MNGNLSDKGPCLHCGLMEQSVADGLVNYTGVDPCLGLLPEVTQACCGHGQSEPYVVIAPGNAPGTLTSGLVQPVKTVLRGADAHAWFAERGVGPKALADAEENL